MLAGKGPAELDAISNDFMRGGDGIFKLLCVARIVEDDGVQIAVAGMKNIADGEAVFLPDELNLLQSLGEFGTRDNAIRT